MDILTFEHKRFCESISMKNLVYILFLFCLQIQGQMVTTKDGVVLGSRNDFISECASSAQENTTKLSGVVMNTKDLCACLSDNLIPNINSWELESAMENNSVEELLMRDDHFNRLMKCMEGNYSMSDDYTFSLDSFSDLQIRAGVKACVQGLLNEPSTDFFWTQKNAFDYCSCAIQKLFSSGYQMRDIHEIENQNSSAFNEIVMPCIVDLVGGSDSMLATPNRYLKSEDIRGGGEFSHIALKDFLEGGYKLKISLGGISRYFLFDTGASDLIIDGEFEKLLLQKGILLPESYSGSISYQMANNEKVLGRMAIVNGVHIGDYSVSNVRIGIIEQGALLCGKSFLEKFSKWELDSRRKLLILYK
jgi:predicted aspartyl protease